MNENMLENLYSARMDELDHKLTETHELDQKCYNKAVAELNRDFDRRYQEARVLANIQF